jgi:sec-independent protein translocase protein TatB
VFNLTGSEVVIILLLALVVLGPEKLPDAVRRFGRTYAELKKMGSGFQQEFKAALDEPVREMRETANLLRSAVTDVADEATQTAKGSDSTKPVSAGGPTDLRSAEVRAADDPPHPDPATADVPFADSTDGEHDAAGEQPTSADGDGAGAGAGDGAGHDVIDDLEQDGEARQT